MTTALLWTDSSGVDHEVTASQRFRLEVTQDGSAPCFLAQFAFEPCDGLIRACHLLPARKIKDHFPLGAWRWPGGEWIPTTRGDELHDALEVLTVDELVYDPRCAVPGCDRCHGHLDTSRRLKIPREALPEAVEEYAADFGLGWHLIREYGPEHPPSDYGQEQTRLQNSNERTYP